MDDVAFGAEAPDSARLVSFDAIMPAAMAARAEETGVKKASIDPLTLVALSILAGAFISFGAIFATTVSAGSIVFKSAGGVAALSGDLPYGIVRLLSGLAFSLGLILVVVAGAELFTGNNLIVIAWASGRVKFRALLINWAIVFAGNCVGALATVVLMFYTTQYTFGGGAIGLAALATASGKTSHEFIPNLALGVMCNVLVCLGVWMCYSARSTFDKVIAIVPPVSAFVAAGFEHCIANIYYIPLALFIKAEAPNSFWTSIGRTADDFPALTWSNFLLGNLIPVTIGNIIGGAVMVAAIYWFIYLRKNQIE